MRNELINVLFLQVSRVLNFIEDNWILLSGSAFSLIQVVVLSKVPKEKLASYKYFENSPKSDKWTYKQILCRLAAMLYCVIWNCIQNFFIHFCESILFYFLIIFDFLRLLNNYVSLLSFIFLKSLASLFINCLYKHAYICLTPYQRSYSQLIPVEREENSGVISQHKMDTMWDFVILFYFFKERKKFKILK